MPPLLLLYLATTGGLLVAVWLLQVLNWLGTPGRRMSDLLCRAPLVDVVLFYFTALPLIVGPSVAGWFGLLVSVGAQLSAVLLWVAIHEITHPNARKGPRIYRSLDGIVGPVTWAELFEE